jgi:hypothetical protein
VWRVKGKADESELSASVNMVFILPMEFKTPSYDEKEEQAMAQLTLDRMQATFDKPEDKEHPHFKPLYVKGYVDVQPMTKMLVDGHAAVNVMPYATYRKLEKGEEDLIKTNMVLKDFEGKASPARGAINVEQTILVFHRETDLFYCNCDIKSFYCESGPPVLVLNHCGD